MVDTLGGLNPKQPTLRLGELDLRERRAFECRDFMPTGPGGIAATASP